MGLVCLDGQGSALSDDDLEMKSTVSNCSLARKQRCDQKKKDAKEAAAAMQISVNDVETFQDEVIITNDLDPSDITYEDKITEGQLEGCIVIQPMQNEMMALPQMMKKWKSNMLYNMQRRC